MAAPAHTHNRCPLSAGKLAGGDLLAASGLFHSIARGPFAVALDGAYAIIGDNADHIPTFHCPLWPGCDCPGGVMRPECPGRKCRTGAI